MASTVTVNKKRMRQANTHGGCAYGTLHIHRYNILCVSGVLQNSDKATAVAANDVIALGILPAGTIIHDAFAVLKTASGEATTMDVGFEYVDGETGTPAADPDAFLDGLDLDGSTGKLRSGTAIGQIKLAREAYITAKNLDNAQASGLDLDICLVAEVGGQP